MSKMTLVPIRDAFIDDTGYFEDGDENELFVGWLVEYGHMKAALQYDLSGIDIGKINSILLRIYVISMQYFPEYPHELNVYASSQMDDWHTSFPTPDSALLAHVSNVRDAIGGFSGELEVELDVSEAIPYVYNNKLTLLLEGSGHESAQNYFYFADSSNTENDPAKLDVSVKEFAGGSGTEQDPYLVATAEHLDLVRNELDAYYMQISDIDMSSYPWPWEPIGDNISPFQGSYDGNGYKIQNLEIHNQTKSYLGLFGCIDPGSVISDLGLTNLNIQGEDTVGGIVGLSLGVVERVYTTGVVKSEYGPVGGIVANNFGIIEDSYSHASVEGNTFVGGLVGNLGGGTVLNSYSTGLVTSETPTTTGGLVGSVGAGVVDGGFYDSETSGQSDTGKGIPKTTAEMKTQSTFVGWDFTDVWIIDEGNSRPVLRWQFGKYTPGTPLTSRKAYVLVKPSSFENGATLEFNDQWYEYVRNLEVFDPKFGDVGDPITHEYGGETVEYDGIKYTFLCSGVQDPNGLGGFGSYTADTQRTVYLIDTDSMNVNFYYVASPAHMATLRLNIGDQPMQQGALRIQLSPTKIGKIRLQYE